MKIKTIGILGDSIAQGFFANGNRGWFDKLGIKLFDNNKTDSYYAFQNMAVGGEKTTDVLHRFYNEALTKSIDILFIATGVNDITRRGEIRASMDISIEYRNKIWRKLLKSANKNIDKIFVLSILPTDEEKKVRKSNLGVPMYRLDNDIKEYNKTLKSICEEFDIQFIDIYDLWKNENIKDVLHDELHPNEKGHQLIAEEVFKQIENKI